VSIYIAHNFRFLCPPIIAEQLEEDDSPEVFEWAKSKSGDFEQWLLKNENNIRQADVCRLLASWSDEKIGTASFNIAEFIVNPKPNSNTSLLVRHHESGSILRVAVKYSRFDHLHDEPLIIRIALTLGGDPNNIWSDIGRGQAETLREKDWKYLSLRKEIQINNKIYSFIFHCENGMTYQEELLRRLSSRNKASEK
jgi:hypothetical protein